VQRRRRSRRVWFLSMSCDTVATHIHRQAECLMSADDLTATLPSEAQLPESGHLPILESIDAPRSCQSWCTN